MAGEENTENEVQNPMNEPQFATTAQDALEMMGVAPCHNAGNPVFSCNSKAIVENDKLGWDPSYRPQNPLYKTSSGTYGILLATSECAPATYHGKSQKFSQHLGVCGMYRNHSLNTAVDKSKVYDLPQM